MDDHQRIETGKHNLRPGRDYVSAAEIFQALSDPSRVKIVDSLLHHELCTSDLAAICGLSEPAVSQHLRLLRTMRVVTGHRHGHRVFYTLSDGHVRSLLSMTMAHLKHEESPVLE